MVKEFNINAKFYDPDKFEDLKDKVTKKTKMIIVENPGSNTFEFQDLSKIIKLAKKKNILTFLDNTWGTPLYLKPLKLGFDLSFTSATNLLPYLLVAPPCGNTVIFCISSTPLLYFLKST